MNTMSFDRMRDSGLHIFRVHRKTLAALAFYIVLYVLFFARGWAAGFELAPGDGYIYYYPHYAGYRTLWDPLLSTGYPAAADPQVMTWYPPAVLLSLIPHSWNAFVILAYVFASWYAFLFVRQVTGDAYAGLVGGVIYGMSGFMIGHLGHPTMIHVAVWLPLILYCVARLDEPGARPWMIVLGAFAVACCIFAGHLQISFYVLAFSSLYAAFRALFNKRLSMLLYAVVLFAAGVALAGVQLLPTIELSRLSERAQMTFQDFASYSMEPMQLITFLFPYVHGGIGGSFYKIAYFGPSGIQEVMGYAGTVPLIAVLLLLVRGVRSKAWPWIVVITAALFLATSGHTSLGPWLYKVPVINQFRASGRFVLFADLAAAVLAGISIAALRRNNFTRAFKLAVVFAIPLVLLGYGIYFWDTPFRSDVAARLGMTVPQFSALELPSIVVPVTAAFFVAAGLAALSWAPRSRPVLGLALTAIVLELSMFASFFSWDTASPRTADLVMPSALATYREQLRRSGQRWLPVQGVEAPLTAAPAELSSMWKIPSVSKYGPLMLSRYGEATRMISSGVIAGNAWSAVENRAFDITAVRLAAIGLPPAPILWNKDEPFSTRELNLSAGKGTCAMSTPETVDLELIPPAKGNTLTLVTSLGCSLPIPQGAQVATVTVTSTTSESTEMPLRAGVDSAEWAAACNGVAGFVKHTAPTPIKTFEADRGGDKCQGRRYPAVLTFPANENISRVRVRWNPQYDGVLTVSGMLVFDPETRSSREISPADRQLNSQRWHFVNQAGDIRVFENLRACPRVYLVNRTAELSPSSIVNAIETSKLPDGSTYDPRELALVEEPVSLEQSQGSPGSARIVHETNTEIEIESESTSPAFLVLADLYYPGWKAWVNDNTADIVETNYIQRGVKVPAGRVHVRMAFRPSSLYLGLGVTSLSGLMLVAGLIFATRRPARGETEKDYGEEDSGSGMPESVPDGKPAEIRRHGPNRRERRRLRHLS